MADIIPGNLKTYGTLINLSNITQEDIEEAIAEWEDNPPDEDFKNILQAEIVEVEQ